jgi:DnaJ domain
MGKADIELMIHAFDSLNLPISLTLSDEQIQHAFRERSKYAHPDAGGDAEQFSQLEKAKMLLLDPAKRLKLWLHLIHQIHMASHGAVPHVIMDYFEPISLLMQQGDELIQKRHQARSSLAIALLEPELNRLRAHIQQFLMQLQELLNQSLNSFSQWEHEQQPEEVWSSRYRAIVFLSRWQGELKSLFARSCVI